MLQLFAMSGDPVCVTRSTDLTGKIEQRVNVLGQANTQFFTSGKLINLVVFFSISHKYQFMDVYMTAS